MPARISDKQWKHFDSLRAKGWGIGRACDEVGIGRTAAWKHERDLGVEVGGGAQRKIHKGKDKLPEPIRYDDLGDNAKAALDDFGFFRLFYLGRESTPWQERAGYEVLEYLETEDKEYVVINCPPGSGKSTLFTHDIPCWIIARERAHGRHIRMLIGSKTASQAKWYTAQVRRTLERPYAVESAAGCLAKDFGRFKPEETDLWRSDEFIVEQLDGQTIDVKEATVMAAAQETGFLGGRFDFAVWDDLIDNKNMRTQQARDSWINWFEVEAETRIEAKRADQTPKGGLFLLQGQRIGPTDGYRYALDLRDGEPPEGADDEDERPNKYHHIVYQAHYEDRCKEDHGRDAAAWPDGCLLDPTRLSWRELSRIKANNPRRFQITMQQEDVDPEGQLVQQIWLDGGQAANGETFLGCYDNDRSICQLPEGVEGRLLSVLSVDPSPSKFWSVQWWIYHFESDQRFLMDHARKMLRADDFLDRVGHEHVGVAEDWVRRARNLGWPISHLVFERNAAQKFMLQYDHIRKWLSKNSVVLIPHDTQSNKADPEFGVQTIASHYRHGRVRLPNAYPHGKRASQPLVDEVTKWPEGATEDCVMAQWFFEYQLRNLKLHQARRPTRSQPSFMRRKYGALRAGFNAA